MTHVIQGLTVRAWDQLLRSFFSIQTYLYQFYLNQLTYLSNVYRMQLTILSHRRMCATVSRWRAQAQTGNCHLLATTKWTVSTVKCQQLQSLRHRADPPDRCQCRHSSATITNDIKSSLDFSLPTAYLLQCLGWLSLPPSEERWMSVNLTTE